MTCCAVSTVSGAPGVSPLTPNTVRLLEDFYTDLSSTGGAGGNAFMPDLGWTFTAISGAPSFLNNIDGEPGHPGILRQAIGNGQLVHINMGDVSGGGPNPLPVGPGTGGGPYIVEWGVRLNQLATVAEPFDYIVGLHRRPARPNELTWPRACFRADSSSANWLCETHQAATTQVDSGVAISTGNWQTLRVAADANWGAISFFIDGVLATTISTNVPTDTLSVCSSIRDAGGVGVTLRTVDVDYAYLEYSTTRPA